MDALNRSLLVAADFTLDSLVDMLNGEGDPGVPQARLAPYDQVNQILLDANHPVWQQQTDALLVWTRPEAAIPVFAKLTRYECVQEDSLLAEVRAFAARVAAVADRVGTVLLPTWTQPPFFRGTGILDMRRPIGVSQALMRMNLCLTEALAGCGNVYLLDASRWLAMAGERACHPKLWYMGKILFGNELLTHAAADIKAALHGIVGGARKLIVVDLDDTLWGGIVGDVGWPNIQLGGHGYLGEAFRGFQEVLKALTNRGVLVAIASKNEEQIALDAIERHPGMVLRQKDFVAWRINWQDKAENIAEIAAELNLGLDSVVFLDDSPAERARVRETLPTVLVPELPADKTLYARTLQQLRCFDTAAVTVEDNWRTPMYHSERGRQAARDAVNSVQEWLAGLALQIHIEPLGTGTLKRATQLLNKTNQMNLCTRRMSEHEFDRWAGLDGHFTLVFSVSDRFGEYGLTGIGSLSVQGDLAEIEDFLLSCRVFGRGVEATMLSALASLARQKGAQRLIATLLPTEKNQPTRAFFDERSGMRRDDGDRYSLDLAHAFPVPDHILCRGHPAMGIAAAEVALGEAGS